MKLATKTFSGNLLFLVLVITFFASCQKDLAFDTVASINSRPHLTSIYSYDNDYLHIDSFSYNISGHLARLQQWTYNTTGTIKISDSAEFVFSFSGNGLLPSSYKLSSLTAGTSNSTENHFLYYDVRNKLVKDSLLNGTPGSQSVTNYNYGTNYIVVDKFLKNNSGLTKTITDSFFTSASKNVTNLVFYNYNATNGGQHNYTYNTSLNPCYDTTLAESLGAWLTLATDNDFISQNSFITITVENWPAQPFTSNFTWATDATGRIIKGQQVGKSYFQTFQYSN